MAIYKYVVKVHNIHKKGQTPNQDGDYFWGRKEGNRIQEGYKGGLPWILILCSKNNKFEEKLGKTLRFSGWVVV